MSDGSTPDSRVPVQGNDGFDCPRCGAFANQWWASLYGPMEEGRGLVPFSDSEFADGRWTAATCARCGEASVWRGDRMVFPASGAAPIPHPSMPPEAKALYEEAREVVGISRRAGAALARAALERVLRTLDPDAGNVSLALRIERIIPEVPDPVGQMLTIVRIAGNASLHVGDDEPDDVLVLVLDPGETEIVELIFEAINDLVEAKIAKPNKVANLYSKIPESLREKVDKVFQAKGEGAPRPSDGQPG
ncbi:DUF4145 domain-containing protein [Microbacterium sp. P05]|uniref:DUF4145 domain-containing protein n=1 Tax=Microbacterium sp. P05 TaxID=3366948 RepID=UPI003744DDF5